MENGEHKPAQHIIICESWMHVGRTLYSSGIIQFSHICTMQTMFVLEATQQCSRANEMSAIKECQLMFCYGFGLNDYILFWTLWIWTAAILINFYATKTIFFLQQCLTHCLINIDGGKLIVDPMKNFLHSIEICRCFFFIFTSFFTFNSNKNIVYTLRIGLITVLQNQNAS